MIRFADGFEPNKDNELNDDSDQDNSNVDYNKVKKLLQAILNADGIYEGAFHEDVNLVDLVEMVNKILFEKNKNAVHLIIDKNLNNSLDITIDKIE